MPVLQIERYIINLIRESGDPRRLFHNWSHTENVLRAANHYASEAGLDTAARDLLKVAALYHDVGYVFQERDHVERSVRHAEESLPGFGLSDGDIRQIVEAVWATRAGQQPTSLLGELLCDADLDHLGRADFLESSRLLREENELFGIKRSDLEWVTYEIEFLRDHCYHTPWAHRRRDAGKLRGMKKLQEILKAQGGVDRKVE